jgi:hypothetical protein
MMHCMGGTCTALACATAHIQDTNNMHLHCPLYGMTPASCMSGFFYFSMLQEENKH